MFGWFNRVLDSGRGGYTRTVKGSLKRTGRLMLVYAALLIGLGWAFVRLPGGFLPVDEQRQRQSAHRRSAESGSVVLLAVLQVASQFGWVDEVRASHSGTRQALGRDEATNVALRASEPVRNSGSREPPMHVRG